MNRGKNEEIEIGISGIRKLTEVVNNRYNFDLAIYASTSLKRRISKIINQKNLRHLDDLIQLLDTQPAFFPEFQLQLSVDGTEFFRDPAFWRSFRDDICKSLDRNHQKIRIWIPGCSSGEEVVSTAITLTEAGVYDKASIVATDLNSRIISESRKKIYQNSLLEISENNYKRFIEDESADFSKYIHKQTQGFTFADDLYKNISYEVYDEPEKSKLKQVNVILCRNYFIYLTAQFQEKLLTAFTDRLMSNGYFAIGNKENISFCKDASKYVLVNESEKIYRKNAG